jgi:hypothetical protein
VEAAAVTGQERGLVKARPQGPETRNGTGSPGGGEAAMGGQREQRLQALSTNPIKLHSLNKFKGKITKNFKESSTDFNTQPRAFVREGGHWQSRHLALTP